MTDAQPSMALDALTAVRDRSRAISGMDNTDGFAALRQVAPLIACWQYGHPEQPARLLRRWRQRPWRCARCGTWWVTEHYTDYSNYDSGGAWRWVRVEKEGDHA